jgi:hypothetical protein
MNSTCDRRIESPRMRGRWVRLVGVTPAPSLSVGLRMNSRAKQHGRFAKENRGGHKFSAFHVVLGDDMVPNPALCSDLSARVEFLNRDQAFRSDVMLSKWEHLNPY